MQHMPPTALVPAAVSTVTPIGVAPRRWLVLLVFCAFGCNNQVQMVQFANVVRQAQAFFGCSATEINLLSAAFSLVYLILIPFSASVVYRAGLRRGLLIGAGCNAVGAAVKFAAALWWRGFAPMMIGQLVAAVGMLFFLSLPPILSAVWFPDSQRALSTAAGSLMGFAGLCAGFSVPPVAIPSAGGAGGLAATGRGFTGLFGALAGWAAVVAIAVLLLVPDEPPRPPSVTSPRRDGSHHARLGSPRSPTEPTAADLAAEKAMGVTAELLQNDCLDETPSVASTPLAQRAIGADTPTTPSPGQHQEVPPSFFAQLRELGRSRNFVLLAVCFATSSGIPGALGSLLAQLLEPYGVSEKRSGAAQLVGITAGCLGCVAVAPVLDSKRRYRVPLVFLYGGATLLLGAQAAVGALLWDREWVSQYLVPFGIVPLFPALLLPSMPVGMEFAVELTFPLAEVASSAVLMWCNAFGTGVGTMLITAVVGDKPTRSALVWVSIGCAGLMALTTLLMALVREDRRRLEQELRGAVGRELLVAEEAS